MSLAAERLLRITVYRGTDPVPIVGGHEGREVGRWQAVRVLDAVAGADDHDHIARLDPSGLPQLATAASATPGLGQTNSPCVRATRCCARSGRVVVDRDGRPFGLTDGLQDRAGRRAVSGR